MRLPSALEESNIAIAIDICRALDEPMIYELLFDGVARQSNGTIQWNLAFDVGERVREAGRRLLPKITPGSMVHESLWNRVTFNHE